MGHPRLRPGQTRPDGWWAVPGREAQPIGQHGPIGIMPARWLRKPKEEIEKDSVAFDGEDRPQHHIGMGLLSGD
uniref:Uncharacterized protein n=1 Tax=Oryza sativa subsp. japonica TaxID=39947 RepID=Q5VNR3_ORYSJ|nr:hypothetical protein [Oryza sativa Japonica Group]